MRVAAIGIFCTVLASSSAAPAQTTVVSPDTTVSFSGTVASDEEAIADAQTGSVYPIPLGTLPFSADLTGYDLVQGGDSLFTIDTTTTIGGVTATPSDVVRFGGGAYVLEFDGSAESIPAGVHVDAVAMDAGGALLLSFDTTVDLGGVIAQDEDVLRFEGGSFIKVFDGTAQGVDRALDLDGVGLLASGSFLFSFDGSGSVSGVSFDDEDILEFEISGSTWSLFYDGADQHPALVAADIVAVPEPGSAASLGAGVALLHLAFRRSAIAGSGPSRSRRRVRRMGSSRKPFGEAVSAAG